MNALSGFERLLLFLGLLLFSVYASARIYRSLYARLSLVASVPPPLGVLRLPSVDLEVPELEGTDDVTLNRAV
jgi:hypothetical protein